MKHAAARAVFALLFACRVHCGDLSGIREIGCNAAHDTGTGGGVPGAAGVRSANSSNAFQIAFKTSADNRPRWSLT